MNETMVYVCNNCNTAHKDEEDAALCCASVSEQWQCSECSEHYDDREEASKCCSEEEGK